MEQFNPKICSRDLLIHAYVYAKQTVINDFDKPEISKQYLEANFIELIEMIGRIAEVKSIGTPHESQLLSVKIEPIVA